MPALLHPDEARSFGEVFWRAALLYPERIALQTGDGQFALTYAQLEARTQRAARLFAERGVTKGAKVLLILPNDYRFAEVLFGAMRAGGVAVPANVKLGKDTLSYIANHSESIVMVGHASLADKVEAVREAVPGIRHMLMLDGGLDGAEDYDAVLASTPDGFGTVPVSPDDLAMLMYTSGSTGLPKGCLLTHRSKWFTARSGAQTMIHDESETALITGPLYHANAFWGGMLPMFYVGGSLVILPGFDAVTVLETIDRFRITGISGTPSMFTLMLAQRDVLARVDVSSVRLISCGSAPVPAELLVQLQKTFPASDVVESYGMTETGANVLSPRWGLKKLGSCGLPAPGFEIRIARLDDPAQETAPDEVGELWARSPANITGYYKQPDVTAERLTPDGWLITGDLMSRDEQDYIYFRGRRDDMINVGGENVYPKEIETILLTHPAVADAAVVAVRHAVKGCAPVAWVVLHHGAQAGEDELKQHFLANGPAYAHPRRVFFLDALPVSGTNKIDRKYLTQEAERRLPDGLGGT